MNYYHGTTIENFIKILKKKILITEYGNEKGIYITKNYSHAELFGEIVIVINSKLLDKNKFEIDDVNDGIFYKNGIDLIKFSIVFQIKDFDSKLFAIFQNLGIKYFECFYQLHNNEFRCYNKIYYKDFK